MNNNIHWPRESYDWIADTPAETRQLMMPTDADIQTAVRIDESDVFGELRDAPAVYTYWSFHKERLEDHAKKLRRQLDVLRQTVYEENALADSKATVRRLEAKVEADRRVILANANLASAERDAKYAAVVVKGIEKKIDCLRSMNSQLRTEQELSKSSS